MPLKVIPKLLKAQRELKRAEAVLDKAKLTDYVREYAQVNKQIDKTRRILEDSKAFLNQNQRRLPADVWSDSYFLYTFLFDACDRLVKENDVYLTQSISLTDSKRCSVVGKSSLARRIAAVASLVFISGVGTGYAYNEEISDCAEFCALTTYDLLEMKIKEPGMKPLLQIAKKIEDVAEINQPAGSDEIELYPSQLESLASQVEEGEYVLIVDKDSQVLSIYQRTEWARIEELPCTTGKNLGKKERAGDGKTPEGVGYITSITNSSDWVYEGEKAYGPYFLRLSFAGNNWTGIGIHGTNEPETLGSRASRGCIRLSNEDIRRLVDNYASTMTPCIILPEKNAQTHNGEYVAAE